MVTALILAVPVALSLAFAISAHVTVTRRLGRPISRSWIALLVVLAALCITVLIVLATIVHKI